jgi:DNA-binding MarR family transcriptional regulator
MARLFANALADKLRPLGLAPAQFPVLLELWQHDALTQKELVERLDLEQATVGNTLNRMERDGLITRRPHPQDGRSQMICLTARARSLETEATRCATAINARALADLGDVDRKSLLELMQRVIDRLRAEQN